VVNVASPGASGPRWSYANSTITIQNGANLTLTGGPTPNSVSVASGAAAILTLNNMTLGTSTYGSETYRGIDASQAAQVTLLLEGASSAGGWTGSDYGTAALIAAPVTVIDSAASENPGDLATSSRSTGGTFIARGNSAHWWPPAIQGNVTMLGGVLIAQNDPYLNDNTISGTLTARGGVVICPSAINTLVRPADSTAVVFVNNVPSGWYQTNHSDLVVCDTELSFGDNTITLNERLRIPAGVTLRIPAGWTLVTGGHLINDGIIINDGTINGDIYYNSGSGTPTGSGTHSGSVLYAAEDNYHVLTINYHLNGGVLNGESDEVTEFRDYNNEPYTLPRPTRDGYVFLGWFDNEGLSGNFVTTVPAGSDGEKHYYVKWGDAQGSAIDAGMSAASSGAGWSYNSAAKVFTVQNNAAVTFIGITTENRIVVASNATATVTLHDAFVNVSGTANAAFDIGDGAAVTLLLAGTNVLTSAGVYPGIHAPAGTTLVVDSAARSNAGTELSGRRENGSLTVTAGNTGSNNSGNGAGIGSRGSGAGGTGAGTITIYGGAITTTGGYNGAGIGGGNYAETGTVSIKGGAVTAHGGTFAPGIGPGPGMADASGSVTISGGTVTATGGNSGAGIGGGIYGSVNVTITGGSGTATGGAYAPGVGPGRSGSGGSFSGPNGETSWPGVNPYSWGGD
jgi:uncharacterized repeat protein (TIGR02543 family)